MLGRADDYTGRLQVLQGPHPVGATAAGRGQVRVAPRAKGYHRDDVSSGGHAVEHGRNHPRHHREPPRYPVADDYRPLDRGTAGGTVVDGERGRKILGANVASLTFTGRA